MQMWQPMTAPAVSTTVLALPVPGITNMTSTMRRITGSMRPVPTVLLMKVCTVPEMLTHLIPQASVRCAAMKRRWHPVPMGDTPMNGPAVPITSIAITAASIWVPAWSMARTPMAHGTITVLLSTGGCIPVLTAEADRISMGITLHPIAMPPTVIPSIRSTPIVPLAPPRSAAATPVTHIAMAAGRPIPTANIRELRAVPPVVTVQQSMAPILCLTAVGVLIPVPSTGERSAALPVATVPMVTEIMQTATEMASATAAATK